jgi:hypothetical protein
MAEPKTTGTDSAGALVRRVLPPAVGDHVPDEPWWFVIGGQAVRCLCPYRPSRDVDFGVRNEADLDGLLQGLAAAGELEIRDRSPDTVHAVWNGVPVSIFALGALAEHTEGRRLSVRGILATKLHAVLDRGRRRDFFDLYVVMQRERLGIADCLAAIREVYRQPVNDSLLLRSLVYFDDADSEAPLPGEGPKDWAMVQRFFQQRVGNLLVPPDRPLEIQSRIVDLREA